MSETAGSLIKILSALTSPKSSVRYISIGVFLLLSWKYIDSILAPFGVPKEQYTIIISLISVGMGSLVGQVVYILFFWVWNKIDAAIKEKRKNQENYELEKARQESLEKENEEFLDGFKKVFEYFPYWKKDALRSLLDKEQRFESDIEHIYSLRTNNYIFRTTNISLDTDLYMINPAIREFVSAQWEDEKCKNMADFFGSITPEKNELIEVMTRTEEEFRGPISHACANLVDPIHPCFIREGEDEIGFHISFRDPYCSLFSEQTGREFVDELYIAHIWVGSEAFSEKNE
ncbi:hypothetical protein EDC56_1526 [Sinobacterium caligoides]|uniref:Uncharacterized protein n=1 Tax=Sinobacterium caligoides TaxID=933926 RepID=A0A3N2DMV1_9GAMM|nr:hypothetical protein [Sinobacterium caligoides]ROS01100.1 hypothetical protein EDC56_1526 [Sinobacterium caligoides]